jgi:hypothetical protein
MVARIYKPAKTAMSSGLGKTRKWYLDFEPENALTIEPLMGWTSSSDTKRQVRLSFDTKEEAIAYAERYGIEFVVSDPKERKRNKMAYADNFKYDRRTPWTH